MSTNQIERLYKKMITCENSACGSGKIDTRIRAEIFQKIMDGTAPFSVDTFSRQYYTPVTCLDNHA